MIGTLPPVGEVAIHIHRELNGSLRAILAPNQKDLNVGVYLGRWLIISDQIWAEIDKKQKDFEAFQEYLTELK
jgi:hypothetical protein